MTWHVTLDYETYEQASEEFEWDLPADYNAAEDLLRKHDDCDEPALHQAHPDGRRETYTFRELDERSDQFASALVDRGVERGDQCAGELVGALVQLAERVGLSPPVGMGLV